MRFRSIFLAIVLAFAPAMASAQVTLVVNLRIDVPDPDTSDGLCGIRWRGIMRCSLRAAIQEANAHRPEHYTIVLGPGIHLLEVPGAGEDFGATGDLDIFGSVTISGAGAPRSSCREGRFDDVRGCHGVDERATVIRAANDDRVLHIHPGGFVQIQGLAIAGGRPPLAPLPAGGGGGILNRGGLVLIDVALLDNAAPAGGGLLNDRDAVALLLAVTVMRNHAHLAPGRGCGGGIFNGGLMGIEFSSIRSNVVSGAGGGICNRSSYNGPFPFDIGDGWVQLDASLEMSEVTIARNGSDGDGGGIASSASLLGFMVDVTGNDAVFRGGGIFVGPTDASGWAVDLHSGRISGNRATGGLDERTGRSVGAGEGAGAAALGLLRLRSFDVDDNDARVSGGGVWLGFGADVRLAQTTLSGNTARIRGGGVQADWTAGFLEMVNVTVHGNAARTGGGVNLDGSAAGRSRLRSVTFAANETTGRDGANLRASAGLLLRNTIFSDPRGRGGDNCLFIGPVVTREGRNLESGNSCGLPAGDSFVDLQLADFGSEADHPRTMPLRAGSPAVDAVEFGACDIDWELFILVDERGVPRPQGVTCDAGAYERRPFIPDWILVGDGGFIDLGPAASAVVATSLKLRLAVAKQQDAAAPADAIVKAASDLQRWIELALSAPDEQSGRALLKEAGQALSLLRQTMDAASACCGGLGTRFAFINLTAAVDAFHTAYMRVAQPPKPIEKAGRP